MIARERMPTRNNPLNIPELISGTVSDQPYATKITTSGTTTYIGIATPGTAQATATWRCKKIAVSGSDTTITWASGGAFNQVSTDLTTLTYA